jgi:cell division protein FtsQ
MAQPKPKEAPRGAVLLPPKKEPVRIRISIPPAVGFWFSRLLLMVMVLAVVGVAVREGLRRWPVTDIEVIGRLSVLNPLDLASQLLWVKDENFFSLDVFEVYRQLQGLPLVASVAVRKRWPATLQILVYEDLPVAIWNDHQILTASGKLSAIPAGFDGSSLMKLYGADPVQSDSVRIFRRLQQALGNYGVQVTSMEVNAVRSVDATLSNGWIVRFGRQYFDERLQRLTRLLTTFDGQQIHQVDLRYGKGAAIRWQTTGEAG